MESKEALNLLKKYVDQENVINHSKNVARVAEKVATTLKDNGHEIDLEKVKCAALLHDIGRGISHENHTCHSEEILQEEGHPEMAELVKTHGLRWERTGREEFLPKTIEQRIIAYADGRDDNGKTVPLSQRLEALKERRTKEEVELIESAIPRAIRNEKLLLELAGREEFNL